MVLDTSVLAHVLFREPGWEASVALLALQEERLMSTASVVELQAVISQRVETDPLELIDSLLSRMRVEVVGFTADQMNAARLAYLRYGKGRDSDARLNFGDVFSYALAKETGQLLGFVGEDFDRTDLSTVRFPMLTG